MKLLDNYERSTGVAEKVTTDEVTENNSFLDAILDTAVMKVGLHHRLDTLNNTNCTKEELNKKTENSSITQHSPLCWGIY